MRYGLICTNDDWRQQPIWKQLAAQLHPRPEIVCPTKQTMKRRNDVTRARFRQAPDVVVCGYQLDSITVAKTEKAKPRRIAPVMIDPTGKDVNEVLHAILSAERPRYRPAEPESENDEEELEEADGLPADVPEPQTAEPEADADAPVGGDHELAFLGVSAKVIEGLEQFGLGQLADLREFVTGTGDPVPALLHIPGVGPAKADKIVRAVRALK